MATQSVDLAQPRSVRRIIGDTLVLYGRYPLLFLLLAAPVVASHDLLVLAATGKGPLGGHDHSGFATSTLLDLMNVSLVGPLISALHIHAVMMLGEGIRPRVGVVARRGVAVLPVVVAAEVMANIGIWIGLLLLLVPGIVLMLRWAVVAQVAAVEHEGWMPALARSRTLTDGSYRKILSLFFITGGVTIAVGNAAALIPIGGATHAPSILLGIAIHSIAASLAALALALLYFDLCVRRSSAELNALSHQGPLLDAE